MNRPTESPQETRSALAPAYPINWASTTYDISGADTDERVIAMWLAGRPSSTVRAYSADIARLREHVRKPLRRITASDLIEWTNTLGRLKPASQYRRLSAVKSLFTYAHALGYIQLNPAAALRMPRTPDDRASKLLSIESVQALLSSVSGRDRLICVTLYVTGIRESELVALNAEDVRETGSGYALTVRGKGDKVRYVAIPAELAASLREHATSGPLFRSVRGNRLDPSTVYRIVTIAAESAGIRCTPHMLRHAHASHALDAGAPVHVVKETLGHSSLATTSIYVHARPAESSALYVNPPSAD